MYNLIIIGGGPAGITAGIYAARKKLKTLLITKDFVGQVGKTSEIENWPGFEKITGSELMQKFLNHLKRFEIEIKDGKEIEEIKKPVDIFEVKTTKGDKFQSRSVIITSGRHPRPLGVSGEKELMGRGVSYCSICDAPFFKDKIVAVIGGGNSSFQAVLDLVPYAAKIYILEFSSKIRADEIYQEKVQKSGKVEIILNARVQEIKGKERVESFLYQDLISQEIKKLGVQGIFIEIGSVPATAFLKDLVEFNEGGEIRINPLTCETKTPGLFAAGDVTDVKYKQIVVATGEGAKAALSAYNYLQNLS